MDAGISGESDPVHFAHAIGVERALLTRNHDDFQELHDLLRVSGGAHFGLLIVRFDNRRGRDMTPRGIANAIGNLEASGMSLRNQVVILNHWR